MWCRPRAASRSDSAISSKTELCPGRRGLRTPDAGRRRVRRSRRSCLVRQVRGRQRLAIREAEGERAGRQRLATLRGRRISCGTLLLRWSRGPGSARRMHAMCVGRGRGGRRMQLVRRRRRASRCIVFVAIAPNRGSRHVEVEERQHHERGDDAFQAHMRILAIACFVGSGQ